MMCADVLIYPPPAAYLRHALKVRAENTENAINVEAGFKKANFLNPASDITEII
jgi:hypothetical protein